MINDIINKHDPVGLLRMGAPVDEYGTESKMIHDELLKRAAVTIDDLYIIIITVLEENFMATYGEQDLTILLITFDIWLYMES